MSDLVERLHWLAHQCRNETWNSPEVVRDAIDEIVGLRLHVAALRHSPERGQEGGALAPELNPNAVSEAYRLIVRSLRCFAANVDAREFYPQAIFERALYAAADIIDGLAKPSRSDAPTPPVQTPKTQVTAKNMLDFQRVYEKSHPSMRGQLRLESIKVALEAALSGGEV